MAEKGGFKHFMLKEIYEQPRSVRDTTLGRVSQETGHIFLEEMEITEADLKAIKKVNIAACGTSWHAGQAGKFMIESPGTGPGRSRLRQRMALSRPTGRPRSYHRVDFAVRRNRRHARRATRGQSKRLEDAGHLQRGRLDDSARGFRHYLHACRTGNRRSLHQGFYRTTHGHLPVRSLPGPGARHAHP